MGGSHLPICCLLSRHNHKFFRKLCKHGCQNTFPVILVYEFGTATIVRVCKQFFILGFKLANIWKIIELSIIHLPNYTTSLAQRLKHTAWVNPHRQQMNNSPFLKHELFSLGHRDGQWGWKPTDEGWQPHISPRWFDCHVRFDEISIKLQWPLLHVNMAGGHWEEWMCWQGPDTWDTTWINDLCIMGNLKPAVTNTECCDNIKVPDPSGCSSA